MLGTVHTKILAAFAIFTIQKRGSHLFSDISHQLSAKATMFVHVRHCDKNKATASWRASMPLICTASRRSTAHMAPWAVWMGYCDGSGRT